jgi:steroid delta-isomerase-like uncharacterized protein
MRTLSYIIIALLWLLLGCSNDPSHPVSTDKNKETVKDLVRVVWNGKNLDSIDLFFSDLSPRRINNVEVSRTKKELIANIKVYLTGFPDMELNINELLFFEAKVYMNWTITGTNTDIFGDLPATGKKVKVSGVSIFTFDEQGMIIYEDVFFNELSLLQQLGYQLIPPKLE